eukprot:73805_1
MEEIIKRKNTSLMLVHGYIREQFIETKHKIPTAIMDLIFSFFYLSIDIWCQNGDLITVDDATVTHASNDNSNWQSALGTIVAEKSGIHEWKIKINKIGGYSNLILGVVNASFYKPNSPFVVDFAFGTFDPIYYACIASGKKMTATGNEWTPYAQALKDNDDVKLILNLKQKTITYEINDKSMGIAFDDIEMSCGYRFAVSMDRANESVTMISYSRK